MNPRSLTRAMALVQFARSLSETRFRPTGSEPLTRRYRAFHASLASLDASLDKLARRGCYVPEHIAGWSEDPFATSVRAAIRGAWWVSVRMCAAEARDIECDIPVASPGAHRERLRGGARVYRRLAARLTRTCRRLIGMVELPPSRRTPSLEFPT